MKTKEIILERDAIMRQYTEEIKDYCQPFRCNNKDLDEFFNQDAILYDSELLGKSYAWINIYDPESIYGIVTLSNDSVKSKLMSKTARNRLQRVIPNSKRGISFPAVLIGRLGVSETCKGMRIGSQILDYLKMWFRDQENKTGCRFLIVDAYNNEDTLRFYERNGFKLLYRTEDEEREFSEMKPEEVLETRFMYYDLKNPIER